MQRTEPPTFYYDVGSPYAFLAASRVEGLIAGVRWQPVLLGGLFRLTGRSSWALGDVALRRRGMEEIERRAGAYGLPPLRWPDPWPGDYLAAMRVATHAHREGCGREYALEAMRAAFTEGQDLSDLEVALDAAAAAGLDRDRAGAATTLRAVKEELRAATEGAHARGIFGVPTISAGGELFWGDDRLEEAAAALG